MPVHACQSCRWTPLDKAVYGRLWMLMAVCGLSMVARGCPGCPGCPYCTHRTDQNQIPISPMSWFDLPGPIYPSSNIFCTVSTAFCWQDMYYTVLAHMTTGWDRYDMTLAQCRSSNNGKWNVRSRWSRWCSVRCLQCCLLSTYGFLLMPMPLYGCLCLIMTVYNIDVYGCIQLSSFGCLFMSACEGCIWRSMAVDDELLFLPLRNVYLLPSTAGLGNVDLLRVKRRGGATPCGIWQRYRSYELFYPGTIGGHR